MGLQAVFEKYLTKDEYISSSLRKDRKFYISDMNKCFRMRWLKRKGIDSEFSKEDKYVNWLMQIGNLYHDYAYEAFTWANLLVDAEGTVEDDHFKGRFDAILKDTDDSGKIKKPEKLVLVDIKSSNEWRFKKSLEGENDMNYIMQLLTYVYMLRKGEYPNIKKAGLFLINKGPSEKVPHISLELNYMLTKKHEKDIKDEMDKLIEFWEKDILPPVTAKGWERQQKYNNYYPFYNLEESKTRKIIELAQDPDNKVIAMKDDVILETKGELKDDGTNFIIRKSLI